MRMILLGAAGLAAGCAQGGYPQVPANASRAEAESGLACEDPVWDLGEVDSTRSPMLSHTFRLSNRSEESIEIKEVASTCGCLVAEGYRRSIAPGGTTDIEAKLRLTPTPGALRKELLVKAGSSSDNVLVLRIQAEVKLNASLLASPRLVNFGSVVRGKKVGRTVVVSRHDQTPVRLQSCAPQSEALLLEGGELPREIGWQVPITLSLDSSRLPVGDFASSVTLRCEHETFQELRIPVQAVVCEAELGQVKTIFVDRLALNATSVQRIWHRAESAAPPKIMRFTYQGDEALRVELVAQDLVGQGAAPSVRITRIGAPKSSGLVRGTLRLVLDPGDTQVEIPITAYCPR